MGPEIGSSHRTSRRRGSARGVAAACVCVAALGTGAWFVVRQGATEDGDALTAARGPAPAAAGDPPTPAPHADPAATPAGERRTPAAPRAAPGRRPRERARPTAEADAQIDALRRAGDELSAALARARAVGTERRRPDGTILVGDGRDGPYCEIGPDGRIVRKGTFADGNRHGLWIDFPEGGGRSETEYAAGVKHGREAAWNASGTPRYAGTYDHGEMSGTWTAWHADGRVQSTRQYVGGKAQGVMRTYHPNGCVETESFLVDGKDAGPTQGWYDDGALEFDMPYVNGVRQGEAVWYHRSGAVAARGTYVDGELDGTYVTWTPDGREDKLEEWDRGTKTWGPGTREAWDAHAAGARR